MKINFSFDENTELARKLGENGRKATEKKYNWDFEAKKLVKLYEELEIDKNVTSYNRRRK